MRNRMMTVLVMLVATATFAQQEDGPRQRMEGEEGHPGGGMRPMMGGGGPGGEGGGDGFIERIIDNPQLAEQLGMDKDALQKIRDELHTMRLKQVDLRAAMEKAAMEQAHLMTADPIDMDAVDAAIEKTGAIRIEMAKQKTHMMIAMRNILTPEQREKIRTMMQERRRGKEDEDRAPREGMRGKRSERRGNEPETEPLPPPGPDVE